MYYKRTTIILFVIISISVLQTAVPQTDSEMDEPIQELFRSPTLFTQKHNEIQLSTGLELLNLIYEFGDDE